MNTYSQKAKGFWLAATSLLGGGSLWALNNGSLLGSFVVHKSDGTEDIISEYDALMDSIHQEQDITTEHPIYRIVLTGGPCAGKSTAMAHISDRLQALGFRVFRVPEAASLLITGIGMFPPMLPEHEQIPFEGVLLKTKIELENAFMALAKASNKPCVILCDRGTMDTAAYLDKNRFNIVLNEYGWNVVDLRDRRYDGVIHLVSAAIGAEEYYSTENNAARHETLDEARALDSAILSSWLGHPKIRIVDNSTNFANKLARVLDIACQFVGAPKPSNSQRKFIVEIDEDQLHKLPGVTFETFDLEQTYLHSPKDSKGYTYLRRRGQSGIYTYTVSSVKTPNTKQVKVTEDEKKYIIHERAVAGREYLALQRQKDTERLPVKKKVYCFLYNNIYYELHQFIEPDIGLTILNTEIETNQKPDLPPFLKVCGEVTGKKQFSSYYISKIYKDWKNGYHEDWKTNPSMMGVLAAVKKWGGEQ